MEIRELLKKDKLSFNEQFSILKYISKLLLDPEKEHNAREAVIRCLDAAKSKNLFADTKQMLDAIIRQLGYYPYISTPKELGLKDAIAYEFHRPEALNNLMVAKDEITNKKDFVLHGDQYPIYQKLLNGKSVILSAPTSFGKSKIIDAVIAEDKYSNIVIVVPTLALIDETRRRLHGLFSQEYDIITHHTQSFEVKKNIFILTPERVVSLKAKFDEKQLCIDFFVIDEFYKLDPKEKDDERAIILNLALDYLRKKCNGPFYMLGPLISNITEAVRSKLKCEFIHKHEFNTVVTEVERINLADSKDEDTRKKELIQLCNRLGNEQTIIYCSSPQKVYEVAELLLEKNITGKQDNRYITEWLGMEFDPNWVLAKAVSKCIAIHTGPMPRALSQDMVRLFNAGRIQFLICTSTLIEGVNTSAKNIIIYDSSIGQKKLDYFTYNNIKGRAGRMFEHFIGKVYIFDKPPEEENTNVEIPLYEEKQDTISAVSLLVQIDEEDLSEKSKERIEPFKKSAGLPIAIIKENHGIDPYNQIKMYEYIKENRDNLNTFLNWTRFPEYQQLEKCCKLIWDYFLSNNSGDVVRSSGQLAYRLNALRDRKSYKDRISESLNHKYSNYRAPDANKAIEDIFKFERTWATYKIPKLFMALHRIQQYIFEEYDMSAGNYEFYITQVESLFLPRSYVILDEMGIPINFSKKYLQKMEKDPPLEDMLEYIKKLQPDSSMHQYEHELLENTKNSLLLYLDSMIYLILV